jgi:hypothetical protein
VSELCRIGGILDGGRPSASRPLIESWIFILSIKQFLSYLSFINLYIYYYWILMKAEIMNIGFGLAKKESAKIGSRSVVRTH